MYQLHIKNVIIVAVVCNFNFLLLLFFIFLITCYSKYTKSHVSKMYSNNMQLKLKVQNTNLVFCNVQLLVVFQFSGCNI
jgi:hypothetical protein